MSHVYRRWLQCVAIAVTVLVIVMLFPIYGPYLEYVPYVFEMAVAPRARDPLEAFRGFEERLKQGDSRGARRYISPRSRGRYKALLADPTAASRLAGVKNVHELYTVDCEDGEVCDRAAVYAYEYEVMARYEEKVAGKEFSVLPGVRQLEMRFIRLRNGRWQISQL